MGLSVYYRHAYDDVVFIASRDVDAHLWRLEVEPGEPDEVWRSVDAAIRDSHLNWSTPDLAQWGRLRIGDPAVITEIFPDACQVVPAGVPFAVMWDLSSWYNWYDWANPETGKPYRFRFIDPANDRAFEFTYWGLYNADPKKSDGPYLEAPHDRG